MAVAIGRVYPRNNIYKWIHNTVADAISRLDYDPQLNKTDEYTHATLGVEPKELSVQWWKSFTHHFYSYNESSTSTQAHCFHMNEVFANRRLGWELRFLVPISGTPIGSGILIQFTIPRIPVKFFFSNSNVWRVRKSEFRFQNSEFRTS